MSIARRFLEELNVIEEAMKKVVRDGQVEVINVKPRRPHKIDPKRSRAAKLSAKKRKAHQGAINKKRALSMKARERLGL